ncbi:MAG: sugar phosphate nucleotidyltransferase [Proteobacteria bacterium]|nr:sugar phosphate nucleotidyltransferase [Pseudomonadota bacterium]
MKDTAVLLLAGGVGSRLNILVSHRAKPAVPFGGIYRIIDFTLSNIANSRLANVAVLTQYKPLSLMDHIGNGSSWDLSGRSRSTKILPPKTGEKEWDWYRGTADAVRQNLDFFTSGSYKNVLVLSGDHIYHMDYRSMLQFHHEHGAKVTISMIEVPWEETHQFGTAIINEQYRIIEWEEKSPQAKSNLASMGIYVFDRDYLVELLEATKELDFGHHIIPNALQEGNVFAYPFDGYWRDVGTVQAYWDANMDILDAASGLSPEAWKIMSNLSTKGIPYDRPPIMVTKTGHIMNSVISPGCIISGKVENCVLSPGVAIEQGVSVKNSVVMHDTVIKEGSLVERCIIDKKVFIGKKSHIGIGDALVANRLFPDHLNTGLTLIGKYSVIPDNATIGTDCIIYSMTAEKDFYTLHVADGENLQKKEVG